MIKNILVDGSVSQDNYLEFMNHPKINAKLGERSGYMKSCLKCVNYGGLKSILHDNIGLVVVQFVLLCLAKDEKEMLEQAMIYGAYNARNCDKYKELDWRRE